VVTLHPRATTTKLTLLAFIDAMIISHFPHGPTVYFSLHNVQLRHDIESYQNSTVSEQYPHLIFDNFSSRLGVRLRDVLKYLFPVPKEDSKRVMTFSNRDDFVSFRYDHQRSRMNETFTGDQTPRLRKNAAKTSSASRGRTAVRYETYVALADSWRECSNLQTQHTKSVRVH